jgi:tRNA A-37 threonylcarbamoyl transferase component Bud32
MIGATISHYRITEKLGEGGMGVVYKAEDTKLERTVALKFLAGHLLNDEEAKARFLREAKAAAGLHHPNICPVYEIGEADGRTFLSMAFIEGEPLEAPIEQGPLPLKEALDIGRQIADGLEAAHEKGVVHRDIKPANVMVDAKGRATIMDFGLARLTEASRLTKTDQTMGTVAYMSPEQAQGIDDVDGRTDIWALGVVLYEMVAGARPFKGEYDQALLYEIVHQAPEPLTGVRAGVPMELEFIVGKCLAKDANGRYRSAGELLVDLSTQLKKIESGKSAALKTAVGQTSPALRSASKQRQVTTVSLVAAGLLLLLGLTFVAGVRFAGEAPAIATYKRLTFRRGTVTSARFAPDGNTIVYSAAWEGGRRELYTTRPESSESRSLNIQDADILAISKTGEMVLAARPPQYLAASFGDPTEDYPATLLQASLAGGARREVLEDVLFADWTPDGELGVVRSIEGRLRVESPVGNVLYETPDRIASFRISPRDGQIAFSERPFGYAGAWQIAMIDNNGDKTVLANPGSGDNVVLAWSAGADAVWYEKGWLGGKTIRAVTPSGADRIVQNVPGYLRLLDVSEDGRALVSRVNWRAGINCLAPRQAAERDLSWFDASEVAGMSSDGKTILITEFGEGGGIERWGVYLRKTTGEPAARLGDGMAFALSPDGSMALTVSLEPPPELVLLPTGAGEAVRIKNEGITNYEAMDWMPDGRQFVFAGSASGQAVRCYIQDVDGGEPRPITPEGYHFYIGRKVVSPDGEWLAAQGDGPPSLFPVGGGEAQRIRGVEPEDTFVAWSSDGRSIFVSPKLEMPQRVYRVDLSTGKRSFWKALAPADLVGVISIWSIQISADEQSYCYSYARNISDLYLVDGLR